MDIISRAIEKKLHISKSEKYNRQTWEDFEKECKNKKVFLFGVSAVCEALLLRFQGEVELEGILDNDIKKHGFTLDTYVPEMIDTVYANVQIKSVFTLESYEAEEVIVLIASTNYYEAIIEQLENMGIHNHFVILIMEANKRSENDYRGEQIDEQQRREAYIIECCNQEIDKKKIVFYAFGTYSDHGKYISEELLRIRNDLDIVWLVNDLSIQVPSGMRKVYAGNWKKYIYEMETAGVWIYNMVVPRYIVKRPGQIYIQTKHWASVTLKKFYLDASTVQDIPENVEKWKYNGQIMDYIITGSEFDTDSCRRGFDFEKEVIQVGSPRTDALFNSKVNRKKVYSFYKIKPEIHTVMYAPTYRFDQASIGHQHESRGIDLDFKGLKSALEKRFGGEWYIILRLHPSVAKESKNIRKTDFIIDAGDYEDSEELVAACDMMISDYSSIMFEPAFVKKPVLLFATDKEEYIEKEYDLLIDYDSLPFPIAEDNEALLRNVEEFDYEIYRKNVDAFLKRYGVCEDGNASVRAAEFINTLVKV